MRIPTGGNLPTAYLDGTSAGDSDSTVDVTFDKAPTGSDFEYAYLAARHTGNSLYRLRTKLVGTGTVQLSVTKVRLGTETVLATQTISGLTFTPGQYLRMRFLVSGTGPVSLSGKLWSASGPEPGAWQVTVNDATNTLGAGTPGLAAYLVAGAANAPVTVSFANLTVILP
jgi:hypothetical protein